MRISYLCLEPYQSRFHVSGYAVHLNEVQKAFTSAGHKVDVIVLGELLGHKQHASPTIAQSRRTTSLRELVRRVAPLSLWGGARDARVVLQNRQMQSVIRDRIKEFSPDVIYEQIAYLGTIGEQVAEKLKIPRMAELHAPMIEERCRDGRKTLLAGYATRVQIRTLKSAKRIRVVSSALRDYVLRLGIGGRKIVVQPNGVDLQKFSPNQDSTNVRQKYDLCGRFVVGFAGSFFRWHRIDALIRGFANAREHCPNAMLLIVGSGEDDVTLRSLANDLGVGRHTVFTGNIPHDQVASHYAAMDVCTMAGSNWYGSPMKLMEYAAMKKPIIAPDTLPVRDVFSNEECMLIPSGDAAAVSGAIVTLYSNPALRERLASAAFARVTSSFAWTQVGENILSNLEAMRGIESA